jgi:hypothetical protein
MPEPKLQLEQKDDPYDIERRYPVARYERWDNPVAIERTIAWAYRGMSNAQLRQQEVVLLYLKASQKLTDPLDSVELCVCQLEMQRRNLATH